MAKSFFSSGRQKRNAGLATLIGGIVAATAGGFFAAKKIKENKSRKAQGK